MAMTYESRILLGWIIRVAVPPWSSQWLFQCRRRRLLYLDVRLTPS
jgi:hypothetical protein